MNIMLSIVIVYYNIPEQFRRTLYSISPAFQNAIDPNDYEVIVVDNGSTEPPDISLATDLGMNIEVLRIDDAVVSPVHAINRGLNASVGRYVGVFIDGARLASAGLFANALLALRVSERAVVASRGRYLGFKIQRESMLEGYNAQVETELLNSINWRESPNRLFDISVFDESSGDSWTDPIAESNSIFMSRDVWRELGGYCPLFQSPGGGFVNLDVWSRACNLPDIVPIVLLGEATFHQFHGGVATNSPVADIALMHDEYIRVRGAPHIIPDISLLFWGSLDRSVGRLGSRVGQMLDRSIVEKIEQLSEQLRELENSLSWRFTEPMRKIKLWFYRDKQIPLVHYGLSDELKVKLIAAQIDDIYRSRSWRMMGPMRWLSVSLKRVQWREPSKKG